MDNKYFFCLIYNNGKIYITWWAYSNEYPRQLKRKKPIKSVKQ
jgi:hypothetical protein